MSLINCPLPASLGSIPATPCPLRWDQVQKLAFQRIQSAPSFATETALKTQSNWTTLLNAADNTKIIVTPYLNSFVVPASEALKQGGNDNSTLNGVPELKGIGFVTVGFKFVNISAAAAAAIRALAAESVIAPGVTNLSAYFFAKDRNIVHNTLAGFPIYNLVITDPGSEGLNANNEYNVSFDMPGGWSETWAQSTALFNPNLLS